MKIKPKIKPENKPLHEHISLAISKSQYTVNKFAQQMNIKLRLLERYMDGTEIPKKSVICKMNKYLLFKIDYALCT